MRVFPFSSHACWSFISVVMNAGLSVQFSCMLLFQFGCHECWSFNSVVMHAGLSVQSSCMLVFSFLKVQNSHTGSKLFCFCFCFVFCLFLNSVLHLKDRIVLRSVNIKTNKTFVSFNKQVLERDHTNTTIKTFVVFV